MGIPSLVSWLHSMASNLVSSPRAKVISSALKLRPFREIKQAASSPVWVVCTLWDTTSEATSYALQVVCRFKLIVLTQKLAFAFLLSSCTCVEVPFVVTWLLSSCIGFSHTGIDNNHLFLGFSLITWQLWTSHPVSFIVLIGVCLMTRFIDKLAQYRSLLRMTKEVCTEHFIQTKFLDLPCFSSYSLFL